MIKHLSVLLVLLCLFLGWTVPTPSVRFLKISVEHNLKKSKNAILIQHKAIQDRFYSLFHMKLSCFCQCFQRVAFRLMLLSCISCKSAPPELLALCQLQVLDSAFHMVTIPSTVIACWHHQSHRCYTTTFWHHFLSSFFVLTVKRWTVTSSQEDYKVFKRTISQWEGGATGEKGNCGDYFVKCRTAVFQEQLHMKLEAGQEVLIIYQNVHL